MNAKSELLKTINLLSYEKLRTIKQDIDSVLYSSENELRAIDDKTIYGLEVCLEGIAHSLAVLKTTSRQATDEYRKINGLD